MKKFAAILAILLLSLSGISIAQLKPGEEISKYFTGDSKPSATINNAYLERVSSFPYGPAISISVDSIRNLIFVSSGGAALILDGSDPANLQLLTDSLRTDGLVYDVAYDDATQRLYFACGYGGFEIWDVQNPYQPFRYINFTVTYFDVPVPVEQVQIRDNIAVVECSWGFVRSINVTDPYNPFQVDVVTTMGNPSHRIYAEPDDFVHTTGEDGYFRFYMDAAGHFSSAGGRYFAYGGAYEVSGTHNLAFVGFGNPVYILDLNNGLFPVLSAINVNGNSHIEARNNLVYITNSDGLHIWNIADPANPFWVSTTPTRNLSSDFVIAGDYLYAAERSSGFDIVDISDPENPFTAGSYEGLNETRDVWVDGNYAYLSHIDDGVLITDISNLNYPVLAGQYDTPGYCYNLIVRGNLLFVTGLEDGLRIADVFNPANPVELSNVSGFNAWRVEAAGNYAYVIGRIFNQTDNLIIFDISNPSNPIQLYLTPIPGLTDGIVFYNNYLFLAAGEAGLRIVDVSDPYNPVTVNTLSPASNVESVTIRNNYAYVATLDIGGTNDGFFILDITDPENPAEIGHYTDLALTPFDVEVSGDFLYLTDDQDLAVFLITDPANPVYLESIRTPDLYFAEFAVDSLIFVADREAGLQIYKNIQYAQPGGGLSWHTQFEETEAAFASIFFTDVNNGWAAGYSGMLYHTTNGGYDWIEQQSGTTGDINSIYFSSSQKGWFVGSSGQISGTLDGGNSWQQQVSGTPYDLFDISFADEMNGWAVGDQVILHTTNGGNVWSSQSAGYPGGFTSVDFVDLMNGWATDISDVGKIIRTTDGGNTWTVTSGWSGYLLFAVDFVNENTGYCVGMFGAILKTTNGGNTWVTQPDPPPHDWLYSVHFLNEETGWVVGFNGKVIYTTDGGSNWSQQTSGTIAQLNSVCFVDQSHGWSAGEDPLSYGGVIISYSTEIIPVELTSFTASDDKNNITLLWQTATETNNSGFEVLRSTRDDSWNLIGFVEGHGTTTEENNYSFVDKNLKAGNYSYKLVQIDFAGTRTESEVVNVEVENQPLEYSLKQNYPNPFNPSTTIEYSIPENGFVELNVFNVLGEKIITLVNESKEAGSYKINFGAAGLSSGIYYYRLNSSGNSIVRKMIILK